MSSKTFLWFICNIFSYRHLPPYPAFLKSACLMSSALMTALWSISCNSNQGSIERNLDNGNYILQMYLQTRRLHCEFAEAAHCTLLDVQAKRFQRAHGGKQEARLGGAADSDARIVLSSFDVELEDCWCTGSISAEAARTDVYFRELLTETPFEFNSLKMFSRLSCSGVRSIISSCRCLTLSSSSFM